MKQSFLMGDTIPGPHDLILLISDSGIILPEHGAFWPAKQIVVASMDFVPVGALGDSGVFACHIKHSNRWHDNSLPGEEIPLRQLYGRVDEPEFWFAGRAAHLYYWHQRSLFCGRCGSRTEWSKKEIAKICTGCDEIIFPRISPAIIVAVTRNTTKGVSILLAKHRNRPYNFYGLIAGFIEPGESAEQAVRREVLEETGLIVDNITYQRSQAWPFPEGLMLGYTANYQAGVISLQEDELLHADFYSAENLPELPPKLSLSRQLTELVLGKA